MFVLRHRYDNVMRENAQLKNALARLQRENADLKNAKRRDQVRV